MHLIKNVVAFSRAVCLIMALLVVFIYIKNGYSGMFEPLNNQWGKDAHMLHTGMSMESFNFIALIILC